MSCVKREKEWGRLEQVVVAKHKVRNYKNKNDNNSNTTSVITTPSKDDSRISIHRLFMHDDGTFPNNTEYPVLLYPSIFMGTIDEGIQRITATKAWSPPWIWQIFTYHHYHSTHWELLLCVDGSAEVQLGGDSGPRVTLAPGGMLLIPPGFAHKQISATRRFTVLGSYPTNSSRTYRDDAAVDVVDVDTLTRVPTEEQRRNIRNCSVPDTDPILGLDIATLCCE